MDRIQAQIWNLGSYFVSKPASALLIGGDGTTEEEG